MLTNKFNLKVPIEVWLNHDNYDYYEDEYYISATSLLKPIKQIILTKRHISNLDVDISDFIASKYGTSIHAGIEEAWLSPKLKDNLISLGFSEKYASRIKVNPEEWELEFDTIPVYLEKRSTQKLAGWIIGGKFDLIYDGRLYDNKSTSVWTYLYGSKVEDYTKQLSIYRWLNSDLVTDDIFTINYIFTDWSQSKAMQQKDYPQCRIVSKDYELMSLEDTEKFIQNKLRLLDKYLKVPDEDLPDCTDEELWRTPPKYKYYKDPTKLTRATKVFDDLGTALTFQNITQKGKGIVITVPGSIRRCAYCSCSSFCKQKDEYIANGLLEC